MVVLLIFAANYSYYDSNPFAIRIFPSHFSPEANDFGVFCVQKNVYSDVDANRTVSISLESKLSECSISLTVY